MREREEIGSEKQRLLEQFLQHPKTVFNDISESDASAQLKTGLYALFEFIPKLLREGKFEEAKILVACNRKVNQKPDILLQPDKFAELQNAISETINSSPVAVMMLLQSLRLPGWKSIVALCEHDHQSVRQLACKALSGTGEKCVPLMLDQYEKSKNPKLIASMLSIFSTIGYRSASVGDFYKYCLRHPDTAIRQAAILAVVRLFQREAEDLLIPLLKDKDPDVLTTVVKGLETTGVHSVEMVQFVIDIVSGFIKVNSECFIQTIRTLSKIDPKPFNNTSLAQDMNKLIGERGLFSLFRKKVMISREVELAVLFALGNVGTLVNRDKLEQLKNDKDLTIAQAAADALARLKKRNLCLR